MQIENPYFFKDQFFEASQIILLSDAISKSEIIGYDIDQIIARSEIPVVTAFNKKHKTNFQWQEHGYGSMWKWLKKDMNFSDDDKVINKEALSFWENSDLLFQAPIIQSTFEFMKLIKILGKKQYIITSRKPNLEKMTRRYLMLNKITNIIPKENIFVNKSVDVKGGVFKALMIKDLGIELMFEDSLSQIEEIVRIQSTQKNSTKIVWIPAGTDKHIKKPLNQNIIKVKDEFILPSLVAQSY